MTFGEAATQWLPRAPKLRNPKSEQIRERSLHHLAAIRDKALTAITPAHIVEILVPLRPETALRVYGVAKAVFQFGAVLLEPEGVNLRPPTDLAKLRALGWSPRSRRWQKRMPALDWRRAPAYDAPSANETWAQAQFEEAQRLRDALAVVAIRDNGLISKLCRYTSGKTVGKDAIKKRFATRG